MNASNARRWAAGFGGRLARDEGGAVMIYASIALTVFMGFAALAIDGSRLFTLDTELESAADALALAGAAELDGAADAQDRAVLAMNALVQNSQTFGNDATPIAGATEYAARFLDALPDDDQPITDDFLAVDAASTRFVEVTVNEREIDSMFATAIGGNETAGTTAVAVAGFTSAVCQFTPLFMCNPYEGTGVSILDAVNDPDERRRLIELRRAPNSHGAKYFPGNFGFLQPGDDPDDTKFKETLGKVDPGACFKKDGVELRTGAVTAVRQALNTRFDMYKGSFKKNDSDYRPAENVTKGYLPKGGGGGAACNAELDTSTPLKAMPFPNDDCSTGGCGTLGETGSSHVWGNGDWDFGKYWDINHGNRNGNIGDDSYPAGKGWTDANPPSRYEVYRWEVEHAIPDKSPAGEDGNPQCYTGSTPPSDIPDRRIIYAAVLDCGSLGVVNGGSGGPYPTVAFLKMFITTPMSKITGKDDDDETVGSDGSIFVEMVDVVKPGVDDAVIHDIVQLYR